MAIGQSRLHEMLRRGRVLSEQVFWFDSFSPRTKAEIIDWIQNDQLRSKGIDATGEVIGYYSYVTSLINPEKKFNTHYTLDDTGAFFRSMYVKVFSDSIVVDANAQKGEDNLFFKYGEDIIGLTDENIEKLQEKVRESYINQLREVLFRN